MYVQYRVQSTYSAITVSMEYFAAYACMYACRQRRLVSLGTCRYVGRYVGREVAQGQVGGVGRQAGSKVSAGVPYHHGIYRVYALYCRASHISHVQ